MLSMWCRHDKSAYFSRREREVFGQPKPALGRTVRRVALVAKHRRLKPDNADACPASGVIMMLVQCSHPVFEHFCSSRKPHGPAQNLEFRSPTARTGPMGPDAGPQLLTVRTFIGSELLGRRNSDGLRVALMKQHHVSKISSQSSFAIRRPAAPCSAARLRL